MTECEPPFTTTLVVMSNERLYCVCTASMSSGYPCSCGSMPVQSAERKGCRHGKSSAVNYKCHYQSASEMRFRPDLYPAKKSVHVCMGVAIYELQYMELDKCATEQ